MRASWGGGNRKRIKELSLLLHQLSTGQGDLHWTSGIPCGVGGLFTPQNLGFTFAEIVDTVLHSSRSEQNLALSTLLHFLLEDTNQSGS